MARAGPRRPARRAPRATSARPAGTRCRRRTPPSRSPPGTAGSPPRRRARRAASTYAAGSACAGRPSTGAHSRRIAIPTGVSKFVSPGGGAPPSLISASNPAPVQVAGDDAVAVVVDQRQLADGLDADRSAVTVAPSVDPAVGGRDLVRRRRPPSAPPRRGGRRRRRPPAPARAPRAAAPSRSNSVDRRRPGPSGSRADPAPLALLVRSSDAGSPVVSGGSARPSATPARPAATSPPSSRYGLAARSAHFTSRFAARGSSPADAGDEPDGGLPRLPAPAGEHAGPVRRLQPQEARRATASPAPSAAAARAAARRRTPRRPASARTGRRRRRAAMRRPARPTGARARRCRPPPATTLGENETRRPCRRATARIVCRTSTLRSAAATGSSAPTETSNWPGAYSGWSWSTSTPSRRERGEQVGGELATARRAASSRTPGRGSRRHELAGRHVVAAEHPLDLDRRPGRRSRALGRPRRPSGAGTCGCSPGCGSPVLLPPVDRRPRPARAGRPARPGRTRSGNSRRSPSGPPRTSVFTIESSARNVSNTGDMPTPRAAAEASRDTGMPLTRVDAGRVDVAEHHAVDAVRDQVREVRARSGSAPRPARPPRPPPPPSGTCVTRSPLSRPAPGRPLAAEALVGGQPPPGPLGARRAATSTSTTAARSQTPHTTGIHPQVPSG